MYNQQQSNQQQQQFHQQSQFNQQQYPNQQYPQQQNQQYPQQMPVYGQQYTAQQYTVDQTGQNQRQFQPPPPVQQQYTAYPEYDPQSQGIQNRSFQNHSLAGWNDPPKVQVLTDALKGVASPETTIVSILTSVLDVVKARAGNQRLVIDTEKRIEFLFEKLAGKELEENLLAALYEVCKCKFIFIKHLDLIRLDANLSFGVSGFSS